MQNKLILFMIFLFMASSAWLFHSSDLFLDPNMGKNWWSLEFEDPKSESLNFILKNHSEKIEFEMAVLAEDRKILSENLNVSRGEEKRINLDDKLNEPKEKRIIIQIENAGEKKEIYKNF